MPYDEQQTMVVRITDAAAKEHGTVGSEVRLSKSIAVALLENSWAARTTRRAPVARSTQVLPEKPVIDPGTRARAAAPKKRSAKDKNA